MKELYLLTASPCMPDHKLINHPIDKVHVRLRYRTTVQVNVEMKVA